MNRQAVIDALTEDIAIHENWIDLVTATPSMVASFGSVAFHEHWIAVYRAALSYLNSPDQPTVTLGELVVSLLKRLVYTLRYWRL